MNRGYTRVRPLEGGLDAWHATGRGYEFYDYGSTEENEKNE